MYSTLLLAGAPGKLIVLVLVPVELPVDVEFEFDVEVDVVSSACAIPSPLSRLTSNRALKACFILVLLEH